MPPAKTPPATAPKLKLSAREIETAIRLLGERIAELENFDIKTVVQSTPELAALSASIASTLERAFGENTSAYARYAAATKLQYTSISFAFDGTTRHVDYQAPTKANIIRSIALLRSAQSVLQEDLEFATVTPETASTSAKPPELSNRVFVVHGHDEGAREMVARFLQQLDLEPIILHEQANQGRTVMEKVEAHGEVGFAVVLLTPDDEGCVKGGILEPRARQNVLLELGYFLGRLGRDKVCALKRGHVEIPSDFAGVVWDSMEGQGWKQALGRELEAAGHAVDWNKVMRR